MENPPPANRRFGNIPISEIQPLIEKMRSIAAVHDKTVSQVALNWVMYAEPEKNLSFSIYHPNTLSIIPVLFVSHNL